MELNSGKCLEQLQKAKEIIEVSHIQSFIQKLMTMYMQYQNCLAGTKSDSEDYLFIYSG